MTEPLPPLLDASDLQPGEEQHQYFYSRISKKHLLQYDYRDGDGKLFSCVAKDLETAHQRRDEWLTASRTESTPTA